MQHNHITLLHPSMHLIGGAERLITDFAVGLADEHTTVEVVTGVCHSIWRNELLKNEHVSLRELKKKAPGNMQFWLNVKGYSKAMAKLINKDTDLIVASSFPSALVATFQLKPKKVKIVHYLHEAPIVLHDSEGLQMLPWKLRLFYQLMSWRYAKMDVEAVQKCDLIIANSILSKRINAEVYSIEESAIEVVYPCVNTNIVTVSSKVPEVIRGCIAAQKPVIFVPRGVQFWRRPRLCLQALKSLRVKDFVAVFTGGTDYEVATLKNQAKEFGLTEKVLCLQELSSEDVNAFYSHSTVVVSIPKRQPFGMIPLEALVCGTPSVIFDSSGVSEVLRDGKEVLCVPDGNLEQLTNAIETLILDSEIRKKLVINGRRKVLNELTSIRFVEDFKAKLQRQCI
jgi:glycosyltransferase involved in cell wall biosynthesis